MLPFRLRLVSLLLICCLFPAAIWATPDKLVKRVPQEPGQQPTASQAPVTSTPAATSAPPAGTPAPSGSASPPAASGSGSGSIPASGSPVPSASGIAALPTSADFGNSVQPGYAVFLQPTSSKSVWPIYRIDPQETVTFSWTYSGLLVRPLNLTLAAIGPQSATYTISQMDGGVSSVEWAISNAISSSPPLMNGLYNIKLYDNRGISAFPAGGYLLPFSRLSIGFYSTENYNPDQSNGECPFCFYSAAMRYTTALKPLLIAFGVACVTSTMFIYGLLN